MPSYRPKSLNELNSIYDKKLAAENAMKKGSSQLNDKPAVPDTNPPVYEPYKYEESQFEKKAQAPVNDISDAVNEFIKNFGKEDKKPVKVQNIHPVQTTVHSTKIASKTPHKPHTKVETPKKKAESQPAPKKQERTTLVRNDERSDLMDDYKRIMMDEDEDSLSIKERLALKKKNKAEKKESKKEAKQKKEQKKAEKKAAEQIEKAETKAPEGTEIPEAESKADVDIIIETDDISAIADSFISNHVKETEVPDTEEEIVPVEEDVQEDISNEESEAQDVDVQGTESEETVAEETESEEAEPEVQEDEPEQPESDEEYFDNSEEDMFDSFVSQRKTKSTGGAGRVISLLLLFVMLILTAAVGSLKYVANVDTGRAVFGKYYVFTAKESFTSMNINLGDLVVSENRPTSSDETFVYYDTTGFRFAKPSDIVSPNSYVVTAENDSGTVLASTDNVRGTVILSLPFIGKIVGLIMSNFLVVFLSLTGLSLVMIIITAILFAKGRKRQQELLFDLEGDDEEDSYYEDGYDSAEESYSAEQQQEIPEYENGFEEGYDNAEYAYTADSQSQADVQAPYSEEENEIPMPFYELADEEDE